LILTAAEKRVVAFVLAAFFLGLAVQHYRETHRIASSYEATPSAKTKKLRHKRAQPAMPPPNLDERAE
jgi:hypothetical protein